MNIFIGLSVIIFLIAQQMLMCKRHAHFMNCCQSDGVT